MKIEVYWGNDFAKNHIKLGEDMITNYLPPPKYSAAIDHVGPIYRNQNHDGPCDLTNTQSISGQRLRACRLSDDVITNSTSSRSFKQKKYANKKKSYKQYNKMINIGENNKDLNPYP